MTSCALSLDACDPHQRTYLPILADIQPAELRRQGATLFLTCRSLMDPKHFLHQLMFGPTVVHEKRLQSHHPFVPETSKLLNELSKLSICAVH